MLQQCENCNVTFSWRKIYKALWGWMYPSITCKTCRTEHKITFPGRLIFVSFTILPTLLFINFLSPFNNFVATVGVGISILIIGSLLAPFFIKYKT